MTASAKASAPGQLLSGKSITLISNQAYSLSNFRGELIADLVAAGATVYALAPDQDDRSREALQALGATPLDYDLDRTGLSILGDIKSCWSLYRLLRGLSPDIVLSYFMKPVIYGSIAAKLAGVPRIFALVAGLGYVFSDETVQKSFRQSVLRWIGLELYALAFGCCRKVFFQNGDDIADMRAASTLPEHKAVRLNGTGVNLDKLKPAPLPKGPVTFLLMARLLRQKGIAEYAAAAGIVKASGANARFILLGGLDPNPDGLRSEEVQAWADEGILEWPGQTHDVLPYLRQANVYVLPSYYREGVPRSTQEAMALGRPVITTDNIGCRETVIDGETGYLIPVRDVEALVTAMERFIAEPKQIAAMGKASRKLVENRFDVRKVNAAIIAVLTAE